MLYNASADFDAHDETHPIIDPSEGLHPEEAFGASLVDDELMICAGGVEIGESSGAGRRDDAPELFAKGKRKRR